MKSELSGDLEELILAMFKPTTFYDAYSIHKAMEVSKYLFIHSYFTFNDNDNEFYV